MSKLDKLLEAAKQGKTLSTRDLDAATESVIKVNKGLDPAGLTKQMEGAQRIRDTLDIQPVRKNSNEGQKRSGETRDEYDSRVRKRNEEKATVQDIQPVAGGSYRIPGSQTISFFDLVGGKNGSSSEQKQEETPRKGIPTQGIQPVAGGSYIIPGSEYKTGQQISQEYKTKRNTKAYEKNFGDGLTGAWKSNKALGRITQDVNAAYNAYLANPTKENLEYAKKLEKLAADFQIRHKDALDEEGTVALWVKDLASYLPQFADQLKAQVAGGAAGAAAGSVVPGVGTVLGAKAGIVTATGIQSFQQMRGAAFRELLAAGIDEETARKACMDEAVISALIEMGDTVFDLATLGTGAAITKILGKETAEKVAKTGAAASLKKFASAIGKYTNKWPVAYALNIAGEGLEEGSQQAVSIANRDRAKNGDTGIGNLAGKAIGTAADAFTGKNDDAKAEIIDAAKTGMRIAAVSGGVTKAGSVVTSKAAEAHRNKVVGEAEAGISNYDIVQEGLGFAEGTEPRRMADALSRKLDAPGDESVESVTSSEYGALRIAIEQAKAAGLTSTYNPQQTPTSAQGTQNTNTEQQTRAAEKVRSTVQQTAAAEQAAAPEQAAAVQEQAEANGERVTPSATYSFMAAGDTASVADRKARVLERMRNGESVSNTNLRNLDIGSASTRAVIEAMTGMKVPMTNDTQTLLQFGRELEAHFAIERAQQEAAQAEAAAMEVQITQVEQELQERAAQAEQTVRAHEAQRAEEIQETADAQAADVVAQISAEADRMAREAETSAQATSQPGGGDTVRLSDGTRVTQQEFISRYLAANSGKTEADAQRMYADAKRYAQTGEAYPATVLASNDSTASVDWSRYPNLDKVVNGESGSPKTDVGDEIKPARQSTKSSQQESAGAEKRHSADKAETKKQSGSEAAKSPANGKATDAQRWTVEHLNNVLSKRKGAPKVVLDFDFTDGSSGYYDADTNTIHLNGSKLTTQQQLTYTLSHELVHSVHDAKARHDLTDTLLAFGNSIYGVGGMAEKTAETWDTYVAFYTKKKGLSLEEAKSKLANEDDGYFFKEELAANIMRDVLTKPDVMRTFAQEQPTPAQWLRDKANDIVNGLIKRVTKADETTWDIIKQARKIADTLGEGLKIADAAKETSTENRHSVVRDSSSPGGLRVIADRDIFAGVTEDERISVLKRYLNENLRGAEITNLIDDEKLHVASKNKDLQKLWRPGLAKDPKEYEARLQTAGHIDEVAAASYLDRTEGNKKPVERPNRGDVQKRTVLVEIPSWDENGKLAGVSVWEAELTAPLKKTTGKREAYDISKLTDKTKNTHSVLYRLRDEGLDVDRVSLERIIAENLDVVKPEVRRFSVEAEDLIAELSAAGNDDYSMPDIDTQMRIYNLPEVVAVRNEEHQNSILGGDRRALQRKAYSELSNRGSYTGTDAQGYPVYGGEVRKEKKAFVVIGWPGSGKSSKVVNPMSKEHGASIVDLDDIRAYFPEYKGGKGASDVQQEGHFVRDQWLDSALATGENIVYPVIGAEKLSKENGYTGATKNLLKKLKAAGYEVELHLVDATPKQALARSLRRLESDGRYTPPELILGAKGDPRDTFRILRDDWSLVDNDVRHDNRGAVVPDEALRDTKPDVTENDRLYGRQPVQTKPDEWTGTWLTDKQLEKITKNKNFKKYFEGVHDAFLDAKGRPLRLFHGTPSAGFFGFRDPGDRTDDGHEMEPGTWTTPDVITAQYYTHRDDVQEFVPFVAKSWEDADKKLKKHYGTLGLQYDDDEGFWQLVDYDPDVADEDGSVPLIAEFNGNEKGLADFNDTYATKLRDFDRGYYGGGIYQVFMAGKNPLIINGAGASWNAITPDMATTLDLQQMLLEYALQKKETPDWSKGGLLGMLQDDGSRMPTLRTRDVVDFALEHHDDLGFDTVIFRNIFDAGTTSVPAYDLSKPIVDTEIVSEIIRRHDNFGFPSEKDAFLRMDVMGDVDLSGFDLTPDEQAVLEQFMQGSDSDAYLGDRVANKIADVYVSLDNKNIMSVHNQGTWGQAGVKTPEGKTDFRFSVDDTAYMDAVESGDTETVQRMVDEAAKAAGYPQKLYHGTKQFGFTQFDLSRMDDKRSIFATSDANMAASYGGEFAKLREVVEGGVDVDNLSDTELLHYAQQVYGKADVKIADEKRINMALETANGYLEEDVVDLEQTLDDTGLLFGRMSDTARSILDSAHYLVSSNTADSVRRAYNAYRDAVYKLSHEDYDAYQRFRYYAISASIEELGSWKIKLLSGGTFFYLLNTDSLASPSDIREILKTHDLGSGVYALYGKTDNLMDIDAGGAYWSAIDGKLIGKKGKVTTRDVSRVAKRKGLDGVVIRNLIDYGGDTQNGEYPPRDVFIYFNENALKSADPVTYDDAGNVIPLSERFDTAEKDLRFSVDSSMPFKSQVNTALRETTEKNRYNALYIRETPNLLAEVGLGDLPLCITAKHVKDIVHEEDPSHKEWHGIPIGMAKRIPELLSKPVMLLDSETKPGDVVVVTSEVDRKHRPVLITIHPNGEATVDGERGPANFITSMYGRNGFDTWLDYQAEAGRVLFWDKKRSDQLFNSAGISCPGRLKAIASDEIIREHSGYVKENIPKRRFSVDGTTKTGGNTGNVNPDTGYERGSVADSFMRIWNTGDRETALSMLENVVQRLSEIEAQRAEQRRADATATAFRPAGQLTEDAITRNKRIIEELIAKYGKMEQTSAAQQEVRLPKQRDDKTKTRGFVQTAAAAKVTPEAVLNEFERAVVDGSAAATYVPVGDQGTLRRAEEALESEGFENLLRQWEGKFEAGDAMTKDDIAKAEQLYVEACHNRDTATAMKLAGQIAVAGTQAGQTVQAMTLLKKMTPSGKLYYLQKTVDRLNKDRSKKGGPITINEQLAKQLLEAQTTEEVQAALDAICQDLANQMPVTLKDKWNTWRYLAMLGNPRTHIRNLLGNAVFTPARLVKDMLGTVAEKALPQEQRTKAILIDRDLRNFAKQDAEEMKDTLRGGGKYNPADLIRDKRRIFRLGALNWAEQTNSAALEAEDWLFLRSAYTHALRGFLTARGADVNTLSGTNSTVEGRKLLEQARAYAIKEAQKATYRDMSKLAGTINHLKRNTGAVGEVFLEGLVPFTKTPINIVKRGIEYSPAGLVKGLADMATKVRKGNMTAAEGLDELCAGLTGTAIIGLGALLTKMGLLVAGHGDDEEDNFEELQGIQEYSLRIGDSTFTVDWTAPVALPLFVGSEIFSVLSTEAGEDVDVLDVVLDGLTTMFEPMLSLSMLDGLNSTLSANKYGEEDDAIYNILATVTSSYFSQAVPTLFGQIARTADDSRRASFTKQGEGKVASWLSRAFQTNVQGKIPVAAEGRMLYIDNWGRADTEDRMWVRALENFLSPGYINEVKTTPVEDELSRLAQATKNTGVYPDRAKKYFTVDKENYAMSQEEYQAHLIERGQHSYKLVGDILNDPVYEAVDDETRAMAVELAYDYASGMAKKHTNEAYAADKWMLKLDELEQGGGDAAEYLLLRAQSKISGDSLTEVALSNDALTDEDVVRIVTMETTMPDKFTDPKTTGKEFVMDEAQQEKYARFYSEFLSEEYAKLTKSTKYQKADTAERYSMLKDIKSDVGEETRKAMSKWLRGQGIKPTKKNS